jgi:hypothetical protein
MSNVEGYFAFGILSEGGYFNPPESCMWLYFNPASQILPLRKGFMLSQKKKTLYEANQM